ncbi:hypothetical protein NDU88_010502 [Pleurodeles waltl]|uniref:Uncharacterized protein n=1 Tax=Pleurodeles waltl TaxID=8319 RepID=A0AAV7R0R9_PLEWA|nr:hypothetical protein NDU88_010502 [Pleurodeles waltl]
MVGGGSTSVSAGCAPVMALGDGFTEGGVGGLDNGLHEEGLEEEEGFGVGSQWDMSSSPGTPDLSWQGQLDYGDEDPGEQDTARVHWGEGKAGPWAASRIASSGWSRRRSGAADASTGRCGGEGIAPPVAAAQKEQRPGLSGRRSKQRGEYSSCVRCSGSGASAVEWGERSEESLEEGELRNSGSEYEWWESRGRGTSNPVRVEAVVRVWEEVVVKFFLVCVAIIVVMEPNKVVQALKVLQEEGREDLIKVGVLEEAWVGLRRPKRLSAEGVTAAVVACTSPQKTFKKFKSKSALGRKVTCSPDETVGAVEEVAGSLPTVGLRRRGGGRFSRRLGTSLAQRVAAGGMGSGPMSAVSASSRMGKQASIEHARSDPRLGTSKRQAQLPLERGVELVKGLGEEWTLGGASKMAASSNADRLKRSRLEERRLSEPGKMAAPVFNIDDEVVVILDEEVEAQVSQSRVGCKGKVGS